MKEFEIKTIWSNEITTSEIEDFRYVVNTVFGEFCTKEYFRTKYQENIYGPSLIIIVYIGGSPVGANSLWRNDLNGKEAYYSADTCVIHSELSNGVFASMLMTMTKFISEKKGTPLYAFPNSNSFPGFQKLKWNIRWSRKVLFIPGITSNSILQHIDKDYALWWLKKRQGISYIYRFGHYYLIKDVRTKGIGRILGIVDKDVALEFSKSEKKYIVLYYDSDKITFYNKKLKPLPIVYCNVIDIHVPFWKMDSI